MISLLDKLSLESNSVFPNEKKYLYLGYLDIDLGVKRGVGGRHGVVTFNFSVFCHQAKTVILIFKKPST